MKRRHKSSALIATGQTALVLYSVLIVLPTVVFGGLHWHQLATDHDTLLREVPSLARSAADRLIAGIEDRLRLLLESEEARPFYSYQLDYYQDNTTSDLPFLPSELLSIEPPDGIITWFSYDYLDGPDAEILFLDGREDTVEWRVGREQLSRFLAKKLVEPNFNRRMELQWMRPHGVRPSRMSTREVAINRSQHRDLDCLREDLSLLADDGGSDVEVQNGSFVIVFLRDSTGRPRIIAHRTIEIDAYARPGDLPNCFDSLAIDTVLIQGFFIDPSWLLDELPTTVANQVLDESQRLLLAGHAPDAISSSDELATTNIFERLDFQVGRDTDIRVGELKVAMNTHELTERFRAQSWRFLGVAGMMIVSLCFGMGLLVRSVRHSMELVNRTENFVAAVTHELRTPIAAVKMYGEMLREGWIQSEEKQQEYLERIVRETGRLDSLVDTVIEKRKLGAETPAPTAGDLNGEVRKQMPELVMSAGTYGDDVKFDLEKDLPPVLLLPDAIHSILVNLVENARKYAPVSSADLERGAEPIRVTTRLVRGRVQLEVLDRGPGIPADQRTKVFDAFYRIGDEATRKARGTGLGLHIVQLQARAMRARVQALPRPGGGTIFRITFKTLKKTSPA